MQRKIHEPSALLLLLCMYMCMFTHIARVSVDQPCRVAIPARGQLNREESVFFALSEIQSEYGDEQADAGGTAEPVSRDQILRREREQVNIIFPRSGNHEQDWQPYPVDRYSYYMCDHTYTRPCIPHQKDLDERPKYFAF